LGKQRSRDLKDDRYLACAIAAGAEMLVSNDRDLLDLRKPSGIRICTPLQLFLEVRGRTSL
jgi:predicted nucleic acid-binding protein